MADARNQTERDRTPQLVVVGFSLSAPATSKYRPVVLAIANAVYTLFLSGIFALQHMSVDFAKCMK